MTEPTTNAGDVTCIRLLCEEAAHTKQKWHREEAVNLGVTVAVYILLGLFVPEDYSDLMAGGAGGLPL